VRSLYLTLLNGYQGNSGNFTDTPSKLSPPVTLQHFTASGTFFPHEFALNYPFACISRMRWQYLDMNLSTTISGPPQPCSPTQVGQALQSTTLYYLRGLERLAYAMASLPLRSTLYHPDQQCCLEPSLTLQSGCCPYRRRVQLLNNLHNSPYHLFVPSYHAFC
jgi:hypothetical protein